MSRLAKHWWRSLEDARDVSCKCSPRVRLGDGSVCCESGKTVWGAIKYSEKAAEGVDRLVAVLGSSRIDDINALDLPGLARRRAPDNDVQEFAVR